MPADLSSVLQIEVPVIVLIARHQMPLRAVLDMRPGAIIELPKSADADLEILVNDRTIGAGKAVKVGENFGIRVGSIGPVRNRIEAMGPDSGAEAPAFAESTASTVD